MTRKLLPLLLAGSLAFFYSCQKEVSFEQGQPSRGSLANTNGDCAPISVGGTFIANKALGDTNTLSVTVNVAQTGNYTIFTDTINGYYFRGTGQFNATGAQLVTLKGSGTPGAAGVDNFAVIYDTSFCLVPVTVVTAAGGSTGTAAFTIQSGSSSSSSCMNATVGGTYNAGTVTTASNKVDIQVNVTTLGTWSVTTSTVNGYSFAGAGTFTALGVQNITLYATGTPTAGGSNSFPVTVGTTNCSFNVTVTGTTPVPQDHLILTLNTWLSYDTPVPGDTLKTTNVSTASFGGKTYTRMKRKNVSTALPLDDTLYFRKSGNNYWEYTFADQYSSFYFDTPLEDSINILKEGLTTNQTWSSQVWTDAVNGVPTKLRYDFKCTDATATATYNGTFYNSVYKITVTPMISVSGSPFMADAVSYENYYAAGKGLIYQKVIFGGTSQALTIRYSQIF